MQHVEKTRQCQKFGDYLQMPNHAIDVPSSLDGPLSVFVPIAKMKANLRSWQKSFLVRWWCQGYLVGKKHNKIPFQKRFGGLAGGGMFNGTPNRGGFNHKDGGRVKRGCNRITRPNQQRVLGDTMQRIRIPKESDVSAVGWMAPVRGGAAHRWLGLPGAWKKIFLGGEPWQLAVSTKKNEHEGAACPHTLGFWGKPPCAGVGGGKQEDQTWHFFRDAIGRD